MRVEIEETGEAARRLRFTVPAAAVEARIKSRASDMAQRARLDGFRPGHAPVSVVLRRFGDEILREVAEEMIEEACRQACEEHDLTLAGAPRVGEIEMAPGSDFKFRADVDLYPVFELASFEHVELSKPVVEIGEDDIDRMLERVRRDHADFRPVERAARAGDRVKLRRDDGREAAPIVPAEGPTAALAGARAGERRTLDAGDGTRLEMTVVEVGESVLPELNDAFCKRVGMPDLATLRAELRAGLEREARSRSAARLRNETARMLVEKHAFPAPAGLVEKRAVEMRADTAKRLNAPLEKLDLELFREEAANSIKMAFIMNKIVETAELRVDERELDAKIAQLAESYERPHEAAEHFRRDEHALDAVRSAALEEKVFDWVLAQARTVDTPMTFDALVAPPDAPPAIVTPA